LSKSSGRLAASQEKGERISISLGFFKNKSSQEKKKIEGALHRKRPEKRGGKKGEIQKTKKREQCTWSSVKGRGAAKLPRRDKA